MRNLNVNPNHKTCEGIHYDKRLRYNVTIKMLIINVVKQHNVLLQCSHVDAVILADCYKENV